MAKVQKPDLKTIEPYDVSFAEIRSTGSWDDTVQKIATAINVQFTEFAEKLPFVPSRQFASVLREEKLFIIGPSGSGKSRTIIELLRNKRANYDKIFIINPSNPAGLDSGRESISKLSQRFGYGDLVIWDNFPDGLVKRDLQSAFGSLEILNAMPVQNLFIALKPTYLELYRGLAASIPDIYTFEIYCDFEMMKALIKAYGSLEQYNKLYSLVLPNIDKIARLLWQKQPLSLSAVDYYKALAAKENLDEQTALHMAETWLPVYDYFERQFEVIKNIPARREDVEFLYTLRFCYEVGFERTQSSIVGLQKKIFGSEAPAEATLGLGTWIYLSGQNYAMHDSAKNAVSLTDYVKMKICSFLADNFDEITPAGDSELHSLGLFVGKNIEFLPAETGKPLAFPEKMYNVMKRKGVFERALGRGVGESFERLDDSLQERILNLVDTEIEFGVGLADSLGERFAELDDFNRNRLMQTTYQGMLFARYFGQSVGRLYGRLSDQLRFLVTTHSKKNPQFADGLGMGLGYVYPLLDAELQSEILTKTRTSFDVSRGIGFGFGLALGLLSEEDAAKIIAVADSNSELNTGFGMGLAVSYASLPDRLQQMVLDRTTTDAEFAFGVGVYSAFFYKETCPPEIFGLLPRNSEVAYGLGLGYGPVLFYLTEKFRAQLDSIANENYKLDDGIASGLGLVFKHFPPEAQEMFFAKAAKRNAFATGIAYGIGYTWRYVSDSLKSRTLLLASVNNDFARGLGFGFGCHLDYLDQENLERVIAIADKNSELDRGLGGGAAWAWPYFGESAKKLATERMNTRTEFARGMGFGLARVVRQFTEEAKRPLLERLPYDRFFAEGFAEGTGQYLWSVSTEQQKKDYLSQVITSAEISAGLGTGIGIVGQYFKEEIEGGLLLPFLRKDAELRRGLGVGMGRTFKYLSDSLRSDAFRMAGEDVEFATGFGQGLGTVYLYLEESEKDLLWANLGDNGFSRGLGAGLGSSFAFFTDDVQNVILAHSVRNGQLSLGLGFGIASDISYIAENLATKIFELAKSNPFLAAGLGEGCADAFSKLPDSVKNWLSQYSQMNGFALGFGIGIGKHRGYMTSTDFELASNVVPRESFTIGYAIGLGSAVAYIQVDLLREILSSYSKTLGFSRNFGFGLGHRFAQLSKETLSRVLDMMRGNEEFATGLGEGIGHYLPATGTHVIEEASHTVDLPALSAGTASGIAASFGQLDTADIYGILEYAGNNADHGKVLGRQLAVKFAALDQERQSQIVGALQKDNSFSREFFKALPQNMEYIAPQLKDHLKQLILKFQHQEASG